MAWIAQLPAAIMRISLVTVLTSLPLFIAACAGGEDGPTPYDDDYGITSGNINEGAPDNDSLPDDNKADAQYPDQYELPKAEQSVVKSQGSRGVCSIFAATAVVENLYLKAGMPTVDVDFSEQYMQWSVKNQVGAFRNTEGSNVDSNLQAVVRYGGIKEAAWAYESFPWSAANDPACTGGENLPTKCYTNGEPPQSALDAQKFKLPSSRWINTNSIKAHLTTKKTGVGVGMTFFYQSWNHRRSTLPVDADLWRQGVVTYPNADDKTASLMQRAGHAIEIIGWDDTKEVVMRDKDGHPVLDTNGQPKKEKGFWLFKNSWGTASFGVDHPYGAGYGWLSMKYVAEYGSAVVAEVPSLAPAREVCDDAPKADEDGDGKANCDDTDCAMHPSCTSSGGMAHTYTASPNASIPDNSPTGASSAINVSDSGTIVDVKVTTDITHSYRGDLKVTLSHGATSQVIVDGVGGSADDLKQTFTVTGFSGELSGAWTLKVEDTASQDVGTLNGWTLEVTSR
ncbi:MAG TPA: proprotein convertase P-domain-containing protein [Kofleriaceae bacterium]|nr:proprotein convertase P-domain-containing protein [Kofleriaceae bacterium]